MANFETCRGERSTLDQDVANVVSHTESPSREPDGDAMAMTNRFAIRFLAAAWSVWLLVSCGSNVFSASPNGQGLLFELRPGEKYFRVDGKPVFVLGRNPIARSPKAYDEHFRHAAAAGERLMRIHFTFSPPGEKAGQI